jgi:hypothetical protein
VAAVRAAGESWHSPRVVLSLRFGWTSVKSNGRAITAVAAPYRLYSARWPALFVARECCASTTAFANHRSVLVGTVTNLSS